MRLGAVFRAIGRTWWLSPLRWVCLSWRWPSPSAYLGRPLQSGGHLRACGRGPIPGGAGAGYIVAQVLGGAAAAGVFYLVLSGAPPAKWNTFTTISNLYGSGGFSMGVVFLTETVITALFLVVIVGATSRGAPAGFAPIAIGLALTMFHLVAIPISNASLNPARSTATAIFGGAQALDAAVAVLGRTDPGRRDRRRHLSLVTE